MPLDLNDPEVKAAIEEVTRELSENNKKLLKELQNARAKLKTEINPDEHAALQTRNDELQAQLDKMTKAHQTELAKLNKQLEGEQSFTRSLLVDNGLVDAATKAGVKPEYLAAVRAMHAGKVQVHVDGDTRVAKIGDQSVSDFMTSWIASDEGKHFAAAPDSSGGGAQGSKGGGKPNGNAKRSSMSLEQKAAYVKEHGQEAYLALPQ